MARMDMNIRMSIRDLIDDYDQSPTSYLTESDVVASLACRLRECLKGKSVHIGLCPVRGSEEMIVGESKQFDVANRGCAVDIAVLERELVQSAVSKDGEKKYWRYLKFPVEDLKAAIEVKVRVSGNKGRIRDDVKKLKTIGKASRHCLTYLVILDKRARERQLEDVLRKAKEHNVKVFFCVSNGMS